LAIKRKNKVVMVTGGKILFINEIFMDSFSIDLSWNLIKLVGEYKVSAGLLDTVNNRM
jgi:hypothetical protein